MKETKYRLILQVGWIGCPEDGLLYKYDISKKSKGFIATTPLNIYSSLTLIVIFLFILTIRQIVLILSGVYKILLLNTNHFFT